MLNKFQDIKEFIQIQHLEVIRVSIQVAEMDYKKREKENSSSIQPGERELLNLAKEKYYSLIPTNPEHRGKNIEQIVR